MGAAAEPAPLWEFGFGAGAIAFDDYRGSDRGHVYPIPVPYLIYRGSFLRSDRDGVRGLFVEESRVELSISISGTTPVRSNEARAGMPDLDPTLELGPELQLHLWQSADHGAKLDLRLPVRRAITIEAPPHAVGWFAAPHLNLDLRDVGGHAGWDAGLLAGPLYSDRSYNAFYYSVAPAFATALRPAYRAPAGYSGFEVIASLSKRWPRYWLGAFIRRDTLAGAVFEPSALVRRQSYWFGGVGLARLIGTSERLVERSDVR
jgi:outer membrane protein